MQLVIRLPASGDVEGWGLVELQGQLETRDQVSLDGLHIGDLHFSDRGTPNLILGHHLLTGKVVDLEKPYAVLKKKTRVGSSPGGAAAVESEGHLEHSSIEYEVVGLISKKIIFKNRPKLIITTKVTK